MCQADYDCLNSGACNNGACACQVGFEGVNCGQAVNVGKPILTRLWLCCCIICALHITKILTISSTHMSHLEEFV